MAKVQCPVCKRHFAIDIDISINTRGLTVFRGFIGFLGNLKDANALLGFIRDTFGNRPSIDKHVLINRLVDECGIPPEDACRFIQKLQQEGFVSGHENGNLVLTGSQLTTAVQDQNSITVDET